MQRTLAHLLQAKPRPVTLATAMLPAALLLFGCTHSERYKLSDSYESDFQQMVLQYQGQAVRLAEEDRTFQENAEADRTQSIQVSGDPLLAQGIRVQPSMKTMPVSLNDFYTRAIANSSQIKVFSDLPLIRQTAIQEAEGAFDAEVFADGRNDWRDDPVGSTLTTGGADRLVEDDFRLRTGIRKKVAQTGATVYATQEFTYRDSNSQFFVPNDQTGARITVGFNQPLLRGAGKGFNHAVINIAKIDSEIAQKEFIRQTESHLLEITRTYWTLYMARGAYKAKARAFGDANGTLEDLESRENFDALKQQIFRARAATAERKAALVRAESAVRNAEDRLKALVNDPEMNQATALEMIPSDAPITTRTPGDLAAAAAIALENRAEIQQAYLQLKSAGLRRDMSRNELLPVLNFIAETYQAGLSEDDWGAAWDDQWQASPGYAVGLRFDYPLGNNQAEARNIRRRLEMRQLVNQIRTTMDTILLEVKVTVREVQTAYRDLIAKSQSMQAARDDLSNLTERREAMFLGANTSAPAYLEFLLESQDRRTAAEEAFLGALATYNVALVSLERAKGTLLTYEDLEVKRIEEEDPEHIWLEKEDKMLPKLVIEKIAAAQ